MGLLEYVWCRFDGVVDLVKLLSWTKDGNRILAAMTRMDRGVIGWRVRQNTTSSAWQRLFSFCLLLCSYIRTSPYYGHMGLYILLPCFTPSLASSLLFPAIYGFDPEIYFLRQLMMQMGELVQSRLRGLLKKNRINIEVGDSEDSYILIQPAVDHIFRAAASHSNTNSSSPIIIVVDKKLQ